MMREWMKPEIRELAFDKTEVMKYTITEHPFECALYHGGTECSCGVGPSQQWKDANGILDELS